jgi:hypothetical protein
MLTEVADFIMCDGRGNKLNVFMRCSAMLIYAVSNVTIKNENNLIDNILCMSMKRNLINIRQVIQVLALANMQTG